MKFQNIQNFFKNSNEDNDVKTGIIEKINNNKKDF